MFIRGGSWLPYRSGGLGDRRFYFLYRQRYLNTMCTQRMQFTSLPLYVLSLLIICCFLCMCLISVVKVVITRFDHMRTFCTCSVLQFLLFQRCYSTILCLYFMIHTVRVSFGCIFLHPLNICFAFNCPVSTC